MHDDWRMTSVSYSEYLEEIKKLSKERRIAVLWNCQTRSEAYVILRAIKDYEESMAEMARFFLIGNAIQ